MASIRILFVDNDSEFLDTRTEFLEKMGFDVVAASDLLQAEKELNRGDIDLAILDMRLMDDDDEKDMSGLTLAERFAEKIPSIILTSFPSVDAVRQALGKNLRGIQPAIDFVSKLDGPNALIASIRRSIDVHINNQPKQIYLNVSELLEKDFDEAQNQNILIHRIRLILIIIGTLVIISGSVAVLYGKTTAGIVSLVSGSLTEAIGAFFSKLSEQANVRVDNYHKELLELYLDIDDLQKN